MEPGPTKELLKLSKKGIQQQMNVSQQKASELVARAQKELGAVEYCKFLLENYELPEE